jgi:hypothetical protein
MRSSPADFACSRVGNRGGDAPPKAVVDDRSGDAPTTGLLPLWGVPGVGTLDLRNGFSAFTLLQAVLGSLI